MSKTPGIGRILKVSIFATGCAGIVAEFVLSTLATYLIGNAVFQWTLVMSFMLFSMGIGSRISRYFTHGLLDTFIMIEFCLSGLCAGSAITAYGIAAYFEYTDLTIYLVALLIGGLIGMEIPLVTRLNETYEELRINISGVMEKDYYGALLGGLLFAFFALPHLGLTYTPILLGTVNFLVAAVILIRFFSILERKKLLISIGSATFIFLVLLTVLSEPIITFGEQRKYRDKVIYSQQTRYQKIVMTQWKSFYWLYLNGQEQFSTYDEEKYHEPLVHPAMKLAPSRKNVLIIGGGDGLALREVFKYEDVESVTLVDMDPSMTTLAKKHPILISVNKGSMLNPKVNIQNQDAGTFISQNKRRFGVIIIDLPDPDSVDMMHVYSQDFYIALRYCLNRGGVLVTQATSPYFSKKAFLCILKTMRSAGFSVVPYHNHVPTMGEWGWCLGVKEKEITESDLKKLLTRLDFNGLQTRFLNQDAMISMLHFGKGTLEPALSENISVNKKNNPVLYRYYLEGSWGVY